MDLFSSFLKDRFSLTSLLFTVNSLIFCVIGIRYLAWVDTNSFSLFFYSLALLTGHFLLLSFLTSIVFFGLSFFIPKKILLIIGSLFFTAVGFLLMVNSYVYDLYRFHISGFVWDMLVKAGDDIFNFDIYTYLLASLFFCAVFAVQYLVAEKIRAKKIIYPIKLWVLVYMVAANIGIHGIHAISDYTNDTRILSASTHFPYFYGLTAKRFLKKNQWLDFKPSTQLPVTSVAKNQKPIYPLKALKCTETENKYNVLFIVVDTLRADMLNEQTMPNLHSFAKKTLNFTNHFSNGNSTRAGIFSLFYGLPTSYWDSFTNYTLAPVMITRMQELGYDEKVLVSASLLSPPFYKNVFSSVKKLPLETPKNLAWEKDAYITQEWIKFTEEKKLASKDKPFWGVLFFDTPHSYLVPKDYKKFEPYWDSVNHLRLSNDFDPKPYKNVYRTAVHYTDSLIGKVLKDLKDKNLLANTVVVITSDHGEEFNDNKKNYWGHGSNFSDAQLKVPMVIHWPNKEASLISKRTEHFDVAPTLLEEFLGCEKDVYKKYSLGNHLLKKDRYEWTIVHSHLNHALLVDDLILENTPWGYKVLNKNLDIHEDYNLPESYATEYLIELSRFY